MQGVGFAAIVAAGLVGACNARGSVEGPAPTGYGSASVPTLSVAADAAARTCVPTGADVEPCCMALTGNTFTFCLAVRFTSDRYCFTADPSAKTIAPASAPPAAPVDLRSEKNLLYGRRRSATIDPSARGKGLTVCTADKATCHELPIDAANHESKPMAVSDDATLVAIDTHSYGPNDTQKTPGRLETWNAVTGKKLASFEMHYGPDGLGSDHTPQGVLAFFDHTVIAFTMPCALPCSTATMYSVRGKYLGLLASEASSSTAEHFHHDLYVLHAAHNGTFVVQDAATGKSRQPDTNTNWDAVVEPDRIVRVVGPSQDIDPMPRVPGIEVWGPDLKLVTEIAIPMCPSAPVGSGAGS
jgi:hypothetical protein